MSFFTFDSYHSCFRLMEEKLHEPFPDLMQLHFIELPKFVEQEQDSGLEENDRMGKWLSFITPQTYDEDD